MWKFATTLVLLSFSALLAGCGNSSSATTDYTLPTVNTNPPANKLMGGAVQKGALTFAGTFPITDTTTAITTLAGADAKFNHPNGITTDGSNFYVADYLNDRVCTIGSDGKVTTLTDAKGNRMSFNRPTDITTDGTYLFVVESGYNVIRKIELDPTSRAVTTIGSTDGTAGSVDSANMADARFNQPYGITTDGKNLFVTDIGNDTIRWIDISTGAVHTLAGAPGSDQAGSADGIGAKARFNSPARITTNGAAVYVTDASNRAIRMIDIATGKVSTIAGKADTAPGTDDANTENGTDARFFQPNGITTDGANLYVTDTQNNTIRMISLTPPYAVTKIAGITNTNDPNPPVFNKPIGIITDGTSLFVADSWNNLIRKIQGTPVSP